MAHLGAEDMQSYLDDAAKIFENPIVSRALTAAVAVTIMWLGLRLLRRVVMQRIGDNQLRYKARKAVSAGGWLLTILICAAIFSDKLGGLALSLGVVGAGIAFALQEVIASFAGRIAIMFGDAARGGFERRIAVFGDRRWERSLLGAAPSAPVPFARCR
jgi:small-conductance mechanosensitive channel